MSLSIPQAELITFLCKAKRQTYAAQGDDATVTPLLTGSRQLEYVEGDLLYRDIYFGSAFFIGQETVHQASVPVWAMCYAGGAIRPDAPVEVGEIYDFLRAALGQVPPERPYRGPTHWSNGVFVYANDSQGQVEGFSGMETITHGGQPVYQLRYSGGFCGEGQAVPFGKIER